LNDKHLIAKFDESMVVYQFKCYCQGNYVGQTSRQLRKRKDEHIPNFKNFMESSENKIPVKINNAIKRSAIAKYLVNSPNYTENLNFNRY